jgi:SAM-dependent methyltransferase
MEQCPGLKGKPKTTVSRFMTPAADPRLHSAAAERNRAPILEVLRQVLPARGRALEIACGTGQHAAHFAAGLPGWDWQPTDPDPAALASTAAWAADAALPNLRAPRQLDVLSANWPVDGPFEAVFCANLIHISPWPACVALMQGAARCLLPGGVLVVYGPFLVDGSHRPGRRSTPCRATRPGACASCTTWRPRERPSAWCWSSRCPCRPTT